MKTKHVQAYRFVRFVLSAFCLMTLLVPLPSYGADTGTVKGKVIDKADGEGVYGASVIIAGTTIGTATDMNGNFTLQNVPAKSQKVSVSIVGYAPASQVVTVSPSQTAVVSLQLGQTTIMASEVVVGASTYKQNRLDVPVTVNVVSQEKIKQEANPTLDRIIEDIPGVVVTRAGGQTTANIQIRGSNTYQGGAIGTRVQGYYDGFPLNAPESGEIAWPAVNMNAADKVEVLKGAAATLYGSGAMGGVVNVFGHLPEKLEVKAGMNGGFYDGAPSSDQSDYRKGFTPWFWNTYIGLGNKSGKLNYSLLYTHSNDDGYRQNAQTKLDDIKLKARYDIDAKQYLVLSSYYNESTGGYAYAWPSNVATAFGPPTQTTIPNHAYDLYNTYSGVLVNANLYKSIYDSIYLDDTIIRKNGLLGLNYVNMFSDRLSLDTKVYYTYNYSRINYNETNANQEYPTGGGRWTSTYGYFGPTIIAGTDISSPAFPSIKTPGQFNETYSDRYGVGTKLDWRANDHHRFVFGVDGNITDLQTTTVTAERPSKNTLKPIQEKNAAVFIQDEWKLTNSLTSLLSLRYDWSGIDADRAETTAGTFVTLQHKSVDAINPRIALNYKAMDDMSFRASWGRSFRAPTLSERFIRDAGIFIGIPNPSLDKESMTAYEVGMFKQFGDKVSLDIAGFLNNYDNLIESVITGSTFQFKNITTARIYGLEVGLNYRPTNEWILNAAYTYMNATNRSYVADPTSANYNNPDPTWLPYRPEHTASAGATWKPTGKLAINFNGRYVGKYKAISNHTNKEGSDYPGDFILLNTGVKYQAGETVSLSMLCRNIGNVQYEEGEWFRAPGRSYVAGVDFTF